MSMRAVPIILLAMLCFAVGPARADTDQRCLADCAKSGRDASNCLPICTYNLRPATPVQAGTIAPVTNPHRVLAAPEPNDSLVLPAPVPITTPPPMDRQCLSDCEALNYQYDMCRERCARIDCTPGKIVCSEGPGAKFFREAGQAKQTGGP